MRVIQYRTIVAVAISTSLVALSAVFADSVNPGCHTPTASDIQAYKILDQQVPGQICSNDINLVTGGCPTSPYPFLLQHYRPGSASSATGNAGITKLNPDFACRLSKYIQAYPQLYIVSGYRDPQTQASLFNAAVQKYGSVAAARKWVAPPPCSANTGAVACGKGSNHNLGLAADLYGVTTDIQNAASKFGLHYPMSYEQWHVEPSGSVNNTPVPTGDDDGTGSTPPSTLPPSSGTQQCSGSLYCYQTNAANQCPAGTNAVVVGTDQTGQIPVYQCVQQQQQCPTGTVYSNGACYRLNTASQQPQSMQPSTAGSPSTTGSPSTGSTGSTGSGATGSTGSNGTTVGSQSTSPVSSTQTSSGGTSLGTSQTNPLSTLSNYTGSNNNPITINPTQNSPTTTARLSQLSQQNGSTHGSSTNPEAQSSNPSLALNTDSTTQVTQLSPEVGYTVSASDGTGYSVSASDGQGSDGGNQGGSDNTGKQPSASGTKDIIRSVQPPPGSETFTSNDLSNSHSNGTSSNITSGLSIDGALALLASLKAQLVAALTALRSWLFGS